MGNFELFFLSFIVCLFFCLFISFLFLLKWGLHKTCMQQYACAYAAQLIQVVRACSCAFRACTVAALPFFFSLSTFCWCFTYAKVNEVSLILRKAARMPMYAYIKRGAYALCLRRACTEYAWMYTVHKFKCVTKMLCIIPFSLESFCALRPRHCTPLCMRPARS